METMAGSMTLHHLEQVLYLVAGYLFFLTALGVDAGPRRPSYFARYLLMLVAMGVDTLVGVVLMLSPHSPFPSYALDDVHLGGAIMWAGGDGLMMVTMVLLGRAWVQDPSGRVDFGPWLESARMAAFREQTGEAEPAASRTGGPARSGADGPGTGRPGTPGQDLDDDDEALAAYNRMLARLQHGERH
jgi:putative copper resistance protein D